MAKFQSVREAFHHLNLMDNCHTFLSLSYLSFSNLLFSVLCKVLGLLLRCLTFLLHRLLPDLSVSQPCPSFLLICMIPTLKGNGIHERTINIYFDFNSPFLNGKLLMRPNLSRLIFSYLVHSFFQKKDLNGFIFYVLKIVFAF